MAKKKKPVKKKTTGGDSFNVAGLNSILKKVHLGGAIEECLLVIKNGIGTIEAIDPTNCVFVSVKERVSGKDENCELGIIEMATMIKLLDSIQEDEVDFKVASEQITFKVKGRGEARFTLAKPELISTSVGDVDVSDIKESSPNEVEIEKKHVEDFVYFMGLFGSGTTVIESRKNKISLGSGEQEEKSFKNSFGKGASIPDLQVSVYGDLFKSVLNELTWDEDSETPTINIGEDSPVLIQQGKASWALTPEEEE
jgi:hypothetical protein